MTILYFPSLLSQFTVAISDNKNLSHRNSVSCREFASAKLNSDKMLVCKKARQGKARFNVIHQEVLYWHKLKEKETAKLVK